MPRTRIARSHNATPRRRPNDGVTSISTATRSIAPYTRDPRWAMPAARRRTDVFVVDIADRFPAASSIEDDPLPLSA